VPGFSAFDEQRSEAQARLALRKAASHAYRQARTQEQRAAHAADRRAARRRQRESMLATEQGCTPQRDYSAR
jgi:hypothetical protein